MFFPVWIAINYRTENDSSYLQAIESSKNGTLITAIRAFDVQDLLEIQSAVIIKPEENRWSGPTVRVENFTVYVGNLILPKPGLFFVVVVAGDNMMQLTGEDIRRVSYQYRFTSFATGAGYYDGSMSVPMEIVLKNIEFKKGDTYRVWWASSNDDPTENSVLAVGEPIVVKIT